MAVKESFNLAGQPSTWGNPALPGDVMVENALSPVAGSVHDALMPIAAVLMSAGAKLEFTARQAFDAAKAQVTCQGLIGRAMRTPHCRQPASLVGDPWPIVDSR